MASKTTPINFTALLKNDPSFRESIDQINKTWNSEDTLKNGYTANSFVHPALKTLDWRIYETCYGNFYD